MLSDSCFFSPWWSLSVVEQNFLLSSYHAVFGLRHRDKSAKVIGLSGQTRGERDSTTDVFSPQTFTMADANVYNDGCKRLRWRMQTFTGKSTFFWGIRSCLANICSLKHPTAPEKGPGGGEDLTPALLGLEIYHASNGSLTNGAEDRGLVYLHATFLTGTIDTL